ncbi:thioredoxin family protein [Flavobacterium algicola]|uniref:thioredoxin family protein n=1 Tax=Flavobacterium algicola TaxID=556529 RepID=UPI001EFE91C8|nr:thioredoxin family protein [Flavobacterium algicola]MCG9794119.1 thioredoxin family protein [Flavobacterium algicola]
MKKFLLTLLILVSISTQAQDLKWHTNIKDAITVSNKESKPLMLFFTGSDWCGWCIRLQKEVLQTPEFKKWAKSVVLVELDYPRRTPQIPEIKKQNEELQQVFGIQGFPTIFFTNVVKEKDGKFNFKPLGKTGYVAGGPQAWLAEANGIVNQK